MSETGLQPAPFWDQCVHELKIRHSRFRLRRHAASPYIYVREMEGAADLPAAVAAEITRAAAPGPDVIRVLQRQAQAELQALLDALEPRTAHSDRWS